MATRVLEIASTPTTDADIDEAPERFAAARKVGLEKVEIQMLEAAREFPARAGRFGPAVK